MERFGKIASATLKKENMSEIVIHLQDNTASLIQKKHIQDIEIRIDDGRCISVDQRKKIYATLNDIAFYLGYLPEELKELMKYYFLANTNKSEYVDGEKVFSLADCSMDMAREFINFILCFAFEYDVPLSDLAINRTDDIDYYLMICLKKKKCCICGKQGEIHHVDTIGMGNDRTKVDDSGYRKMCLCRLHHTMAHQRGQQTFNKMYAVYGIIYNE